MSHSKLLGETSSHRTGRILSINHLTLSAVTEKYILVLFYPSNLVFDHLILASIHQALRVVSPENECLLLDRRRCISVSI